MSANTVPLAPTECAGAADPAARLSAPELDKALRLWTASALPDGFTARTMARMRAQPRFRLSGADALVALVGAAVAGATSAAAAWRLHAPDDLIWRQTTLMASRILGAIRPADPRVGWIMLGAVLLTVTAVSLAAWVGQPPRRWASVNR